MLLQTSCDLSFDIEVPTPFVLMLRPHTGAPQWVRREEYRVVPSVPISEFTDDYGNQCQRLVAPAGFFSVHTSAQVQTPDMVVRAPGAPYVEVQHLPAKMLRYLLPSRYSEADNFGQMATDITAGQRAGYDQVAAIETWLRMTIRYEPESSWMPLSAQEVNMRPSGSCRDMAHLGIALCRSLCIPTRMVVGYLRGLEPMDLHAWFEAYIDGRWYTFDATQTELRAGYVIIGYGRDAADVAIYNQFGPGVCPIEQRVSVSCLDAEDG